MARPKFQPNRETWVLVGLFLAVLTLGASARDSRNIIAESLTIVDESGEPRITLALDREGRPSVELFGSNGNVLASMELGESDDPRIALNDVSGLTRLEVVVDSVGEPALTMYDLGESERVDLRVESPGTPYFSMIDAYEREIAIEFQHLSAYGLVAYDEDFEERLRVGVNADGEPSMQLLDSDSERVAGFTVVNELAYLSFWDRAGQMYVEVPPYLPDLPERPYNAPAPDLSDSFEFGRSADPVTLEYITVH